MLAGAWRFIRFPREAMKDVVFGCHRFPRRCPVAVALERFWEIAKVF